MKAYEHKAYNDGLKRAVKRAQEHKAYNDGLKRAVERAASHPVADAACFSLYFDGEAIFVRASEAAPPPNAQLILIAQRWDTNTVQVRFAGSVHSEWVRI